MVEWGHHKSYAKDAALSRKSLFFELCNFEVGKVFLTILLIVSGCVDDDERHG